MKYAAIDSMRQQYPLSMLCKLLEVSTSGYHEWRCRKPSARRRANEHLNPEQPDIDKVRVAARRPYEFDHRLFESPKK